MKAFTLFSKHALATSHTSFKQAVLAGITTFFTMAYIIVVAPSMYHASGMSIASSFIGVCIASALATLLSGLISNLPIGFAPGLGLISYFCIVVIDQLGYSWQVALGAVFLSGVIFMVITLTQLRRYILDAIPESMGLAMAAGIGFFIGFIALKNAGVVVANQNTFVAIGRLTEAPVLLFFAGFLIIAVLDGYHIKGAMLISILLIAAIGNLLGLNSIAMPFALPHLSVETWSAFQIKPLLTWQAFPVLFTFVVIALFDTTGSLMGITKLLDFKKTAAETKAINRALIAESLTTTGAAFLGVSTLAPYIESAAGIKAGGRTGLTAIVIALCFLLALFCAPLAASIPPFATAGALFYVACMMIKPFAHVAWDEPTELIPAVITLLIIPLSFSIADGVGVGIISYIILKVALGKGKDIHPMMGLLALIFLIYFSF